VTESLGVTDSPAVTGAAAVNAAAAATGSAATSSATRRARAWLWGTIGLSAGAFALAIALAPPADAAPGSGLGWVLFVASSGHVASTAWAYTAREVRAHAARHRGRYIVAPALLVLGTAALAIALPPDDMAWLLLPYFGWQFFHFQKQNLGLAALAASSNGVSSLTKPERRAILAAGWAGIVGLLAHPALLQLTVNPRLGALFPACGVAFAIAVVAGIVAFLRRARPARPPALAAAYLMAVLFFLPVFAFASPYAAVGGLTIAHGAQYLLLMGMVAGGGSGSAVSGSAVSGSTASGSTASGMSRALSLALLVNIALIGGGMLEVASHLHGQAGLLRGLYGAYLGVVMAHFVIDAGLWRLRDPFPRKFLASRAPYLLRSAGLPGIPGS
jgi:hypothetical protein